jgi:beta-phosphoglucomutase-like phosphatase (HAD superfamily)
VIEDSEAGVIAGAESGASVIALRHRFNGTHDFSRASRVIDSLERTEDIMALIEALPNRERRK